MPRDVAHDIGRNGLHIQRVAAFLDFGQALLERHFERCPSTPDQVSCYELAGATSIYKRKKKCLAGCLTEGIPLEEQDRVQLESGNLDVQVQCGIAYPCGMGKGLDVGFEPGKMFVDFL